MAWTTVKCAECGKEYQVQMYGPHRDREWKQKNWNGHCDNCKEAFKAQVEKERAEKSAKDAELAKESGFVTLEGSIKQIQWAETLRIARIEKIKVYIGKALQNGNTEYAEWLKNKIEYSKKEKSAKFFIDRRDNDESAFQKGFEEYKAKKIAEEFLK
jgi:hypothetical protein